MELRETPFALLSRVACHPKPVRAKGGGAGGIRTLDRALQPYNGLANRRLQPLGHSSVRADMPDTGVSRKRQISSRGIWSRHDSALANGFRKPKPASAAAEARVRLPFDLACALADRDAGTLQRHCRTRFDSCVARCTDTLARDPVTKCILSLKNMGFCDVAARRRQFRRDARDLKRKSG
jgi:hypothetical protein